MAESRGIADFQLPIGDLENRLLGAGRIVVGLTGRHSEIGNCQLEMSR
jgi:hypothetical protein